MSSARGWALAIGGCLALTGCAAGGAPGPLRHLFDDRDRGPLVRVATTDRAGHNNDFVPIDPGQTVTLLDTRGPGLVRHVWMTTKPFAEPEVLRGLVLRIYWDGEADPSVEAPVGDFFAVGFGERAEVSSLLVTRLSGGMNCYWPMPFRERAVLTLTNYGPKKVESVYMQVDLSRAPSIAADEPYFHAHWHRALTSTENPYVLLDTRGSGSYVGTVMSMQNLVDRSLLFLEGNDAFFVDGESTPSIVGTGTEDYFQAGWYFDKGPFSAWSYGATIVDPPRGRVSAFRWHVMDRIPYQRSLRVTIEDGLMFSMGANQRPNADYASVAFYYQREPHSARSSIARYADVQPPVAEPPPPPVAGGLEAEELIARGSVSAGFFQVEQLGYFRGPTFSRNAYVAWAGAAPGAEMTLPLHVAADGMYELEAWIGRAGDGVITDVFVDDARLGSLSFFRAGGALPVTAHGPIRVGGAHLAQGEHRLRLVVTGTDPQMKLADRFVYLDAVVLRERAGEPRAHR